MSVGDLIVLTYHSVYEHVPRDLAGWIHNTTPGEFYRQMLWCRENFNVVDLDARCAPVQGQCRPRLAICFDDGNETAFSTALPILVELGIPATFFLTSTCIDGVRGWRDKIRIILSKGWTREFIEYSRAVFGDREFRDDRDFFLATKADGIESGKLDAYLDLFLTLKRWKASDPCRHRLPAGALPIHELIRYGNHSTNHYRLSSLSNSDQEAEITEVHHRLASLGIIPSRWFAVPFGRAADISEASLRVLAGLGYQGYLLNDGADSDAPCFSGVPPLIRMGRIKAPTRLESLKTAVSAVHSGGLVKVAL